MPVYFEKNETVYDESTIETMLKESVENAINNHYMETGDTSHIDYVIEFDEEQPPHTVQGNLNINYQNIEMDIGFRLDRSRSKSFNLDYFPSTEEEIKSDDVEAIFNYLTDSIDSIIGLEGDGSLNIFKSNLNPCWRE